MKYLYTSLICIACFTVKVNAQTLLTQPKAFGLDTIKKADTSLLSRYLKSNPKLFTVPAKQFALASTNRLLVYSNMPIIHVGANTDRMPIAKPHSDDRMPVKKIEVVDPLKPALP